MPTLRQSGIPVVQASFGGLLAPAATPPEVVAVLEGACDRAIRSPGYQERVRRANRVVRFEGSAGFELRIREDSRAKATTIRRLGL